MRSRCSLSLFLLLLLLSAPNRSFAVEPYQQIKDIEYATADHHRLLLDLYLPKSKQPPLVVWIHGGAWRAGSKANMPLINLVKNGFAV
ncbi:MAG TPA: lipase, partial [Planctomycetaceae bacterium]|nr:lipase [Planctomycetaceae bacterium]